MSQQLMQLLHDKKAALLDLDSIEERKCSAESVMLKSNGQYMSAALALSHSRRQAADVLSAEVMRHLSDLKMPTAEVVIEMQSYPEDHRLCTALGIDRVKFMVRTNSGLPMAEIGKATSGGETARIMLAIKLVMAQLKEAKILIFDEVDSGISGAVSTSVGRKIAMLAQYSQVITITHQPQVASFAKQHLLVSKRNSDSGATYATIASLDGHGHEREVARLLSGDEITPESLGAAKSLIDAAA
jgi:DNA repair protein RecN (Recombination protein N)